MAQLKECVRRLLIVVERSFPFSLMVVQTLRMKIQESPVTCDIGRVGGGEVRGSDADCEKTSCEDVPRLDLTALSEDSSWGGEARQAITLLFSCLDPFFFFFSSHVQHFTLQ